MTTSGWEVNELKGFLSRTSPLHEAVKQKNPSMVAALLQLGADADFRDFPMGRTAFEYAERSSSSAELTQIFRQCLVQVYGKNEICASWELRVTTAILHTYHVEFISMITIKTAEFTEAGASAFHALHLIALQTLLNLFWQFFSGVGVRQIHISSAQAVS